MGPPTLPRDAVARSASELLRSIDSFSNGSPRPLRPYQAEAAAAIIESIAHHQGKTFTVMMARQMGKNETSAQLEAYLLALHARRGGTTIKAAPSFKPQTVNSILRLKETLTQHPTTRNRWAPAFGYMIKIGRASTTFLSADAHANVVGATASLLLEIDEAQDVDQEKYDRDFRPMASATNATTVLYGTAWSNDSLLEHQRNHNLELERTTGERLHFEYNWTHLAAINPHYRSFVEGEIDRLGHDHPSITTQYLLQVLHDAGRLFSAHQQLLLRGSHHAHTSPQPGSTYVAGIDLAGEDENAQDATARLVSPKRDSTVVTIAELTTSSSGQPQAHVVHHVWWTGRDHVWQHTNLLALWEQWNLQQVAIDASGIGAGLAAFLEARKPNNTERYVFTAPSKSKLAFEALAMLNTKRLSLYAEDGSPELAECWSEIAACRYQLRSGEQISWHVPDSEGHDDFIASLLLCAHAAEAAAPAPAAALLRGRGYETESQW